VHDLSIKNLTKVAPSPRLFSWVMIKLRMRHDFWRELLASKFDLQWDAQRKVGMHLFSSILVFLTSQNSTSLVNNSKEGFKLFNLLLILPMSKALCNRLEPFHSILTLVNLSISSQIV
jgi:hypothetical protein